MARRLPFSSDPPRADKPDRGRTDLWQTPLAIRSDLPLDAATRAAIRDRLGRRLKHVARQIDRVSVRFADVNGPRGGVDVLCRVKLTLPALPSLVVEGRGAEPLAALVQAAAAAGASVTRVLRKAGRSAPRGRTAGGDASAAEMPPAPRSTAARNRKRNTAGMSVALEDSQTTPSRKSTRKSKNRIKSAAVLERTEQLKGLTPTARARRRG